jgi:hypothetical protein
MQVHLNTSNIQKPLFSLRLAFLRLVDKHMLEFCEGFHPNGFSYGTYLVCKYNSEIILNFQILFSGIICKMKLRIWQPSSYNDIDVIDKFASNYSVSPPTERR